MKVATLEKFYFEDGGIKILETQGWEKLMGWGVGGGEDFFPLQVGGGGLTLDDTMNCTDQEHTIRNHSMDY